MYIYICIMYSNIEQQQHGKIINKIYKYTKCMFCQKHVLGNKIYFNK